MIDKTVEKIEASLTGSEKISEEKRTELLKLVSELRSEISGLSETDQESALDIARKTHDSTRQATKKDPDNQQFDSSVKDLNSAVSTFEVTHPGLVSTVNAFCNGLADIGI